MPDSQSSAAGVFHDCEIESAYPMMAYQANSTGSVQRLPLIAYLTMASENTPSIGRPPKVANDTKLDNCDLPNR